MAVHRTLVPVMPETLRLTGAGPILLLCDHASNAIPEAHASLGLGPAELDDHIAWDAGAASVTRRLSERLDCPALLTRVSRLLIDCNRAPDDWDSIVELGERTPVPGNIGLTDEQRSERIAAYHRPYHDRIEQVRLALGKQIRAVIAIHSFVPVYLDKKRPWHVGLIHNKDSRIARGLAARLRAEQDLVVGDNEPYAPSDRVYYTLSRHAESQGLPSLMIEIRNDLIQDEAGQESWARRLAPMLIAALEDLSKSNAA